MIHVSLTVIWGGGVIVENTFGACQYVHAYVIEKILSVNLYLVGPKSFRTMVRNTWLGCIRSCIGRVSHSWMESVGVGRQTSNQSLTGSLIHTGVGAYILLPPVVGVGDASHRLKTTCVHSWQINTRRATVTRRKRTMKPSNCMIGFHVLWLGQSCSILQKVTIKPAFFLLYILQIRILKKNRFIWTPWLTAWLTGASANPEEASQRK
jgi:hypothetical protein